MFWRVPSVGHPSSRGWVARDSSPTPGSSNNTLPDSAASSILATSNLRDAKALAVHDLIGDWRQGAIALW